VDGHQLFKNLQCYLTDPFQNGRSNLVLFDILSMKVRVQKNTTSHPTDIEQFIYQSQAAALASELSDKNPCLQHAHRFVISPVLQVWIWVCRKVTIIEHQRLDISDVFINCSIFLVQRLYFLIAPVESKDSH